MALLKPLVADGLVTYSADMWSSKHSKTQFLDFSAHYIQPDFTMKTMSLCIQHFPEQHTANNIADRFMAILSTIDQNPKEARFVTDAGANIKKACRENFKSSLCLCHKFSTAVQLGFSNALSKSDLLCAIDLNVTSLITFVNKTDMNSQLPIRLKSGGITRPWRHLFNKFSSVKESYDSLCTILEKVILWHLGSNKSRLTNFTRV